MTEDPLAEFEELSRRDQRKVCPLSDILRALKPAERKKLALAIEADSKRIGPEAIVKWCKKRNITHPNLHRAMVTSHRKKGCTCYEPKQ